MTKEEVRRSFLNQRRNLSISEYHGLNKKLLNQFLKSFNLEELNVHTFLPIKKNKEVDTYQIIENYLLKKVNWIIPKTNFLDRSMTHYIFEGVSQLETNSYGIPEPMNGQVIDTEIIDVVLVPMLAFDQMGNRVGYGAGYYDRFLTKCKENSLFVGLSFFEPIDQILDVNKFDIPLNYVVTPNMVHSF